MAAAISTPASALEPGLVSDLTWGLTPTQVDRSLTLMNEAGAKWTRLNVNWKSAEHQGRGVLDEDYLSYIDSVVAKTQAAGIKVLMPIADGVPYWASGDPTKREQDGKRTWRDMWKPSSFADYSSFAGRVVERYSAMGVHDFEVWNEPNLDRFWPSGPDAREYTQMLRGAYVAIKRSDPSATVVSGGLSTNDIPFVADMYAAGAGGYFDALGAHPYTSGDPSTCGSGGKFSRYTFCSLETLREVMRANGDGAKKIWLTEFGWSTSSADSDYGTKGVTEAEQAAYITRAFAELESYPWVAAAFVYSLRNVYWLKDDPSQWEGNTGLLRTDFSAKPACKAYRAAAVRATTQQSGESSTVASAFIPKVSLRVRRGHVVSGSVTKAGLRAVVLRVARRGASRASRQVVRVRVSGSGRFRSDLAKILRPGRWRVQAVGGGVRSRTVAVRIRG